MPRKKQGPSLVRSPVSNVELVTLAVFLVGGDKNEVDTEDIAIKVNELAPGRFTWRKYKDQINIELVRAFLSDAKKPKNGGYLRGTGTAGWLLTDDGLKFAQDSVASLGVPSNPVERLSPAERRRRRHEQSRVLASEAFRKYAAGEFDDVSQRDASEVFRLNEYIVGDPRRVKVQKLLNVLGDDKDVGEALRFFAQLALGRAPDEHA
jgi:hypothetical protein